VSIIIQAPTSNCAVDGVGLLAATQLSVDITQDIDDPSGMVCTDVTGGLVIQVSFTKQSDSMAFYDSLTTRSGMNFWILDARAAWQWYLPDNAIVGVVDSTQRISQFSCMPIPGQVVTILPLLGHCGTGI
jgi:hypothetical protein